MKQAARTAKACIESSIFMASLVVTGSPSIDRVTALISCPPSNSCSVRPALGPFGMRIGRPPFDGPFQNAGHFELILRPVQDQRIGMHGRRLGMRREVDVVG